MKKMSRDRRSAAVKAVICISAAVLFGILTAAAVSGGCGHFDDTVRYFIYDMRSTGLTAVMKIITFTGSWQFITALCITLLLIKPLRKTYGIPVSSGAAAVSILNRVIKGIVERPRPDEAVRLIEEGGFSFPSGHSITSMFVYGLLIYLVRRNVKNSTAADIITAVLSVPLVFIGISRIYLGVHFPSDVAAGWCLGIVCLTAALLTADKVRSSRQL